LIADSGAAHASNATTENVGGLVACLSGSCSQATLMQMEAAEALMPVRRLDVEKLLDGEAELNAALAWANERVAAGPILIASSAAPEAVRALQARHGVERTSHAIESAMATLAEALVARGVRRLIVSGGETSGAVVDHLGLKAFQIGQEIAPGVPVLRTAGRAAPMLLALKSGNFGGKDFFARALDLMR
jgi:uncharacterized protein YgbK (DUF1537 family)